MKLIGTLITGRIICYLLLAWTLSLGGLWLYMDGSRDAAVAAAADVATANAQTACAEAKAEQAKAEQAATVQAVRVALEERAKAQADVDAVRETEQAALREEVATARARANQLSTALRRHIDANPLPAAWRIDAERVRLFNAARRGRSDPGAAADRSRVSGVPGGDLSGAAPLGASGGWDGQSGWLALAGRAGWGSAAGVLGGTEGMPSLRAPRHHGWRDPLIPEQP